MGRKKIQISRITDERNRQVTFNKRKFGVMKKAYELSVLCDCEIALIIFSSSNKLYQYASTDMDKVLLKYTEYNEPHESLTNKNIIEALNKKEHKNGACSPDSPDGDSEYQLTPRTEAKYSKIDEAFQRIMQQRNANNMIVEPTNYTLPLPTAIYNESSLVPTSPHMGQNSVSPRPSSSEAESVYPGSSVLEMSNGYPNSTSPVLGGSPSPDNSPIGKNLQIKIDAPKQSPTSTMTSRPNLRVVLPNPHDENNPPQMGNSLNTPVVSLQTPVLSSYTGPFSDLNLAPDMSHLASALSWSAMPTHSGGFSHLGVPSVSPTSSPSPNSVHIKSEPNSPPRSEHHPLSFILSHSGHPSLAHHVVQSSSLSIPTDLRHDYDSGPVSKRPRDSWGT